MFLQLIVNGRWLIAQGVVIYITEMSNRMMEHEFETSDFDKTFVYKENGLTINLSKVVSAGKDDPECHMIAAYQDGQNEPVIELKFAGEKKELLQRWINL
jgi:hypothetical protein